MKTKAKDINNLIYLTDQALDEIFDLKASVEYDEEFMEGAHGIINQLEHHLKHSLTMFKAADYTPDNEDDLPFMEMVYKVDDRLLPFKHLLCVLNNTHLNGFADPE